MAVQAVIDQFKALPQEEQAAAVAAVNQLAPPSAPTNDKLWLIIVSALAVLLVGGFVLVFVLIMDDKETEVLVPLVTGALGALTGLLAPSPVSK